MDKKRSLLNVGTAIIFKFILLFLALFVRRFLIKYLGNEVNGINSLFISLIGFLSVTELGVGSAITFCMYKPIIENDKAKVASLYQLFKRTYLIIGLIMFAFGLCLFPALPYLAKGYNAENLNIYFSFLLMLLSVVLTFCYSSKTSLINAYKDNYITTTISSLGMILQYVLQIFVLISFKSFYFYLISGIIAVIFQWVLTEVSGRKRHKDIITFQKVQLTNDTKSEVTKNIKALFMHRIGGILVNTIDSLIISAVIGVVVLGVYSNYTTIMTAMIGILTLFFTPLTSIIGHLFFTDIKECKNYYNYFYIFNYLIGVIFFLGYYAVINYIINLMFGLNLLMSKGVVMTITINYFVQFMRQSTLLFRDATGTFYYDRWKAVFEGLLNLVLSLVLVYIFKSLWNDEVGVIGVIVATIITNLAICFIIEPYVLYKHAFKESCKKHIAVSYLLVIAFVALVFIEDLVLKSYSNNWLSIVVNGLVSLIISFFVFILILISSKGFRAFLKNILKRFNHVEEKRLQNDKEQ